MSWQSWAVLGVIFAVFILVMVVDTKIELEHRYFLCYTDRAFRGIVNDYKCPGNGTNNCHRCPHYKKYWRSHDKCKPKN